MWWWSSSTVPLSGSPAFTARKQLTSQREFSSLDCPWGNHNTALAEMLVHCSQHSSVRAVPHSCRSTDKMTEGSADMFDFSDTSEDLFVHNPYWKRRQTATWHRWPCDKRVCSPLPGLSELKWGFPPVTSDMVLDWRVTRRRMQSWIRLRSCEKAVSRRQEVVSWNLGVLRACKIIAKQSHCVKICLHKLTSQLTKHWAGCRQQLAAAGALH